MITYQYSVIRVTPNPVRAETVNIGFVVMTQSGPDVRVIESASKIKVISNLFNMDSIDKIRLQLESILTERITLEQACGFFQGSMTLSPVGTFSASSEKEYEEAVDRINKEYITPERSKRKTEVTQKRIITELKDRFETAGIMGKGMIDINNHKVVQDYPLSESEGLYAELLLKNGKYHLTETLDFRTSGMKQKIGESAVKAITMNTAKSIWRGEVNTFVVYAANALQERSHTQQINLVGGYADHMFNLLSAQDMAAYFDHMLTAAGRSINFN